MFLEHVNLTVSDLDASISFYSQLFGWKTRWRGNTSGGARAAHVGTEEQYLALFEAAQPGRNEVDMTAVGLNHFGLVVEDLEAMKERLTELSVEPHAEMDYEPGHRLYFLDRDGIEVELTEYRGDRG